MNNHFSNLNYYFHFTLYCVTLKNWQQREFMETELENNHWTENYELKRNEDLFL